MARWQSEWEKSAEIAGLGNGAVRYAPIIGMPDTFRAPLGPLADARGSVSEPPSRTRFPGMHG
jgi:hypothetical protein